MYMYKYQFAFTPARRVMLIQETRTNRLTRTRTTMHAYATYNTQKKKCHISRRSPVIS